MGRAGELPDALEPDEPPVVAAGAQRHRGQRADHAHLVPGHALQVQAVPGGQRAGLVLREDRVLGRPAEGDNLRRHGLGRRDAQPGVRAVGTLRGEVVAAEVLQHLGGGAVAAQRQAGRAVVRRVGDVRVHEQLVARDAEQLAETGLREAHAELPRAESGAAGVGVVGVVDADEVAQGAVAGQWLRDAGGDYTGGGSEASRKKTGAPKRPCPLSPRRPAFRPRPSPTYQARILRAQELRPASSLPPARGCGAASPTPHRLPLRSCLPAHPRCRACPGRCARRPR